VKFPSNSTSDAFSSTGKLISKYGSDSYRSIMSVLLLCTLKVPLTVVRSGKFMLEVELETCVGGVLCKELVATYRENLPAMLKYSYTSVSDGKLTEAFSVSPISMVEIEDRLGNEIVVTCGAW
jgi:hypothetical protein